MGGLSKALSSRDSTTLQKVLEGSEKWRFMGEVDLQEKGGSSLHALLLFFSALLVDVFCFASCSW